MINPELFPLIVKYVVPGFFSVLFRIFGLGARSKKAAVAGMAFYLAVSVLVPMTLIPILTYDIYKRFSFIVIIIANIAVLIISSDSFLKTCFMHFSQANILFWIGTTFSALRRMLGVSYTLQALAITMLCAVLYVIALRYWAKPLRFMGETIHAGWLGLLAVPGCTILTGIGTAMWFGMQENYNEIMMLIIIGLLEFSFVMYLRGLYQSLQEITQLSRENMQKGLLEGEILSYQESLAVARQNRHDLRHHNALILDYLESGNVTEAIEYLHANDSALDESKLTQFSVNPAANAVLRIYDRQAQAEGIAFCALADLPEQLPMTNPELGALLSNLLENAVEACRKVESAKRQLTFHTQTDEAGLRLEVRNSMCGTVSFENGFPQSTKSGGGTGTRSMANIVQKYGGMLRFKQEGDMFLTQIVLPF